MKKGFSEWVYLAIVIVVAMVGIFSMTGIPKIAGSITGFNVLDSSTTPTLSCIESDLGKDFYTKGDTIIGQKKYSDSCLDKKVVEYYCLGGQLKRTTKLCDNGCSNGACIKPVITEQVTCQFLNSNKQEFCYASNNLSRYNCSGITNCKTTVSGFKGEPLMWSSTCNGNPTSVIDGKNEKVKFNCSNVEPVCGNGIKEEGEDCDGTNESCRNKYGDLGYRICDKDDCVWGECMTPYTEIKCNDGFLSNVEDCEGSNLRGLTCNSFGYNGGSLSCKNNCDFDTSKCTGTLTCEKGRYDSLIDFTFLVPNSGSVSDSLKEGETKTYTVGGMDYEITSFQTFIGNSNTVIMMVNGKKTSAITKDVQTAISGGYITISAILINSHAGISNNRVDFLLLDTKTGDKIIDFLRDGETKTYTIEGKDYEVTSVFISPDSPNTAKLLVNGVMTKELTAGKIQFMSSNIVVGVYNIRTCSLTNNDDLSYYPSQYFDSQAFTGKIVVGKLASTSDVVAAIDIAASLQNGSNGTFPVGMAVLDSDISNPFTLNLISVGSPCVNMVTAELMGNPAQCSEGFSEGKGIIKLLSNNGKTQIIVAGYSDQDTLGTAYVLADYKHHNLKGKLCNVRIYDLNTLEVNCGSEPTACVPEGGSLGAVIANNNKECCPGLVAVIPPGIVGTRGTCQKPTVCTDSDGGKNYKMLGTTTTNGFSQSDNCKTDKKTLREFYCSDGIVLQSERFILKTSSETKTIIFSSYNINDNTVILTDASTLINTTISVAPNNQFELIISGETYLFELLTTHKKGAGIKAIGNTIIAPFEKYTCPNGCSNGACNPTNCTDSDGGENYYLKGHISGAMPEGFISEDQCVSPEGRLRETICVNGYGSSKLHDCPNGCSNGACINSTINQSCYDSDRGKNYYLKGTVSNKGLTATDECAGVKIKEFYCMQNTIKNNEYFILKTSTGKKELRYISYSSSDNTVTIKDISTGAMMETSVFNNQFELIIGGIIYKFQTVNENGQTNIKPTEETTTIPYEEYSCPSGCSNGACINQTNTTACTDTDGGKNYFVKGTVTGKANWAGGPNSVTVSDCCVKDGTTGGECLSTSNTLNEAYCSDVTIAWDTHVCPNGCSNGACINSTNYSYTKVLEIVNLGSVSSPNTGSALLYGDISKMRDYAVSGKKFRIEATISHYPNNLQYKLNGEPNMVFDCDSYDYSPKTGSVYGGWITCTKKKISNTSPYDTAMVGFSLPISNIYAGQSVLATVKLYSGSVYKFDDSLFVNRATIYTY
jgi:hypothetical protein